jgi:hypothetical protein
MMEYARNVRETDGIGIFTAAYNSDFSLGRYIKRTNLHSLQHVACLLIARRVCEIL